MSRTSSPLNSPRTSQTHCEAKASRKTSLAEFYQQIDDREGFEGPQALRHARAVALVQRKVVIMGEMNDIRDQLKEEYA